MEPMVYFDRNCGDTIDGYAVFDRVRGISRKSLAVAFCVRTDDAERIVELLNEELKRVE